MSRPASLAVAALVGLGVLTAPAWSQGNAPAREDAAPHAAAPKPDQGAARDGAAAPNDVQGKAEKDSSVPAPEPGGCPLFNRKLELIV